MEHPYRQVDVFSSRPYRGNPVAVIGRADGLTTEQMQTIARWTNLTETTFLCAATTEQADYRVRIFTPVGELPFAGHPTLGSAHAWLEGGGSPVRADTIVQECGAGLIEIRRSPGRPLAFLAPPTLRTGAVEEEHLSDIASALGVPRERIIDHQWVDNGPHWAAVELADAAEVLDLAPNLDAFPGMEVGVFGGYPEGSPHKFEIRAFIHGLGEDPVTGSLNASVAQWLHRDGRAGSGYVASQGTRLQRAGEVHISIEGDRVWVGGVTSTRFSGGADLQFTIV